MAQSCVIDISVSVGGIIKTGRITKSGEAAIMTDVPLTSEQADLEVNLTFLQADLTAGALVFVNESTGSITVKTNSSSEPDDTFVVPAGGYVLVTALEADITKIYVTNGLAAANTLYIRGVKDATP